LSRDVDNHLGLAAVIVEHGALVEHGLASGGWTFGVVEIASETHDTHPAEDTENVALMVIKF
jgi:hypothetical protein